MRVNFELHRVHFLITLREPDRLITDLGKDFTIGRSVPESKTNFPLMEDKFRMRTYLKHSSLPDIYILHEKIAPMDGVDALLFVIGFDLRSLQWITQTMSSLPSVARIELSKVEFKWDFYPSRQCSDFQRTLMSHVHVRNARCAFTKGMPPRVTYYINRRRSHLQFKTYIRPKVPAPGEVEFIRLELTARRPWLLNKGIRVPSDIARLTFESITEQLLWLTLSKKSVKGSWLNFVTNGYWLDETTRRLDKGGIARVITTNRKSCSTGCPRRSSYEKCPLWHEIHDSGSGNSKLEAIKGCSRKRRLFFEKQYCSIPYRYQHRMIRRMRKAYRRWLAEYK